MNRGLFLQPQYNACIIVQLDAGFGFVAFSCSFSILHPLFAQSLTSITFCFIDFISLDSRRAVYTVVMKW